MEIWWWIEPLFSTGIVVLFVAGALAIIMGKLGFYNVGTVIAVIALIPIVVSVISVFVCVVCNIFCMIWEPYIA